MEAAGVSSDGLETLSLIQTARPDVVLLDLIQQRRGLAILRRLAGREDAPPVLVLTSLSMPPSLPSAQSSARHISSPSPATPRRSCSACGSAQKRAEKSPAAVAAPGSWCPHIWKAPSPTFSTRSAYRRMSKGYQYLREGILFTIRDADSTAGITKVLYPTVAKKFSLHAVLRRTLDAPCDRHCMEPRRRGRAGKRSSAVPSPAALEDPRTANSSPRSPSLFCSRSANKNTESSRKTGRHLQRIDRKPVHRGKNIHALLSAK